MAVIHRIVVNVDYSVEIDTDLLKLELGHYPTKEELTNYAKSNFGGNPIIMKTKFVEKYQPEPVKKIRRGVGSY